MATCSELVFTERQGTEERSEEQKERGARQAVLIV